MVSSKQIVDTTMKNLSTKRNMAASYTSSIIKFKVRPMTIINVMALSMIASIAIFEYMSKHHLFMATNIWHKKMSYKDRVEDLRLKIAFVSFKMMEEDTIEEANRSHFIDIGPFYDLIEEALDSIGFRGVYTDLLETQRYAVAMTDAAKALGIPNFQTEIRLHGGAFGGDNSEPIMTHYGIPGDRDFPRKEYLCSGCLWWLYHWVGAITADKLLRDGSLLLDPWDGSRLNDAPSFMKEIFRLERADYPDNLPFHAQHGFVWQYLARTRPDLDSFPQDVAESFCGNLLWKREPIKLMSTDVAMECRHGFGHAVFAILSKRSIPNATNATYSARMQFRTAGGFRLNDEIMCQGYRICNQAKESLLKADCTFGLQHGYMLAYDYQLSYPYMREVMRPQQARCLRESS